MDERAATALSTPPDRRTDDVALADALADLGDRRLDEFDGVHVGAAGDHEEEVAQDLAAAGRVRDLGVELDAVGAAGSAMPASGWVGPDRA